VRRPWETDFVAVSAALGEPLSAMGEALGSAGLHRAGTLVQRLESRAKSARAIALATALAEVFADLERMELQ
jgi:hypothetical protein